MRTHIPSGLFWWILIFAKFDKYNLDSKKKKKPIHVLYNFNSNLAYSEIAEDKKAKNGYTYFRSKTKELAPTGENPSYTSVYTCVSALVCSV